MNRLSEARQAELRQMLEAGCGIRETARAMGMHKETIAKYHRLWGLPARPAGESAAQRWARQQRTRFGLPAALVDPQQAQLLGALSVAVEDANLAADQPAPPRTMVAALPAPQPVRMLLHTFYLRRSLPIQVALPEDFDLEEAERLYRWLRAVALPLPKGRK